MSFPRTCMCGIISHELDVGQELELERRALVVRLVRRNREVGPPPEMPYDIHRFSGAVSATVKPISGRSTTSLPVGV